MADVATADVLRSRASDGEDPQPSSAPAVGGPPTRPGSLSDLATAAMGNVERTTGALADASTARAERFGPEVEDLAREQARIDAEAEATRPLPLTIPPPPSRDLHGFLAPRQGQTPEQSIGAFINAVGLFAAGGVALASGNARTALSALTGALNGWQEGDAERANREFKTWKAETETMLANFQTQKDAWESWFKASRLSLDSRVKGLEIAMRQSGFELDAKKVESDGAKYLLESIQAQQAHADQIETRKLQIEQMHQDRVNAEEGRALLRAERERHDREMEKLKEREFSNMIDSVTPDTINKMAQARLRGDPMPSYLNRDRGGRAIALRVDQRTVELANEAGISVEQIPGLQADLAAKRKEATALAVWNGRAEAQASRLETHLKTAVQLSAKVDDSGSPAWNRLQQQIAGKYLGDADTANLQIQMNEVAMEYAKLTVAPGIGDWATREHAREMLSSWMTQPQLKGADETLSRNARNNVENNRAKERELRHYIDTLGGALDRPAPKPAAIEQPNDPKSDVPKGYIGVRKIGDPSQRGAIPKGKPIPPGYEEEK